MEEGRTELIDRLRVIWKRKIFIIVGTLICIAVGVAIGLMSPAKYNAQAILRIGKIAEVDDDFSMYPNVSTLDLVDDLTQSIPIRYGIDRNVDFGYHLSAETIGKTNLLRLTLRSSERGVEKLLKGVVSRIVEDHRVITEASIRPYRLLIKKLEADSMQLDKQIALGESRQRKLKEDIKKICGNTDEKTESIPSTYLVGLSLISSEAASIAKDSRSLRGVRNQLLVCQSVVSSFKEYNTELVSGVGSKVSKVNMLRNIVLAGFAGFIMFIFLVFIIAYLRKVMEEVNTAKG
jgi:capsular polysaccharide biosynthesis protein